MAPSAAAFRITVETAVNALLKYKDAKSSDEKLQLLPDDDYIYLKLTLKKIPSNTRKAPFKIPLSHPLMDPSAEVCLIIDDRPQTTTPPSEQIKKLVKSQNLPISKVLKLSKLKSNYKPYEARRKLCGSYELFLVDKRVVHLLPRLIGKEFFHKKKLPLGVDLGRSNLKLQVEKAFGSGVLYIRTGTCCVMKVAKVAMDKEEIVENVIDAVRGAIERVPKKWDGVRSMHLKFCDSVALPLYQVMPDMKLKIHGIREMEKIEDGKEKEGSESEIARPTESNVVRSAKRKKNKGRIHDVHYMDAEDEVKGDDLEAPMSELQNNDGMLQLKVDGSADDAVDVGVTERNEAVVEVSQMRKAARKRERLNSTNGGEAGKDLIASEGASGSKKSKRKAELEEKSSKKKAVSKEVKHKNRVR